MKNPKTHVAIVLDKSGSMGRTKDQAVAGYNEQVQELKENAKDGQEILVSLVTFNGKVYEHIWNEPVENLSEADPADYTPLGATAMRDAVGYTVQKLMDTTDPDEENVAYLVIVISDGQTNSDRHFSTGAVRELVEGCEATDKWTFTYMGCSKKYMEELARDYGIPCSNMASWSNATADSATKGMRRSVARSSEYFGARGRGDTKSEFYMCDVPSVADFTAEETPDVVEPNVVDLTSGDAPKQTVTNESSPDVVKTSITNTGQPGIADNMWKTYKDPNKGMKKISFKGLEESGPVIYVDPNKKVEPEVEVKTRVTYTLSDRSQGNTVFAQANRVDFKTEIVED